MLKKMVDSLIALTLLVVPSWCVADQSSPGPEAVLDESIFEFQPLVEGTQVEHDFIIHNRGDAPLKILKIKSG